MEIAPHDGAGPIRFGQSAEEVHRVLGTPIRRLGDTEQFASGWTVTYDAADRVEYLQTGSGRALVTLDGFQLVGAQAADVHEVVRAHGYEPRDLDRDGRMYVHELGIGFMGDPVESVWIYPRGYYDEP